VDVRTDDNVLPTTPPSGGLPLADLSDLFFLMCTEMFVHREAGSSALGLQNS
jgi:hypothetical protein